MYIPREVFILGKDSIVDGEIEKMSIKIMHVVEIEEKGAYNKHMISKL